MLEKLKVYIKAKCEEAARIPHDDGSEPLNAGIDSAFLATFEESCKQRENEIVELCPVLEPDSK